MDRIDFRSEVRYAIRLTERTARLYRKLHTASTFASIIAMSGAVAAIASHLPLPITIACGAIFTLAQAGILSIRPADKAAQNETDAKRYQTLLAQSLSMNEADLEHALEDARQGGIPEIETLRAVAYNDVAIEGNRPDAVIPLTFTQRALAALA